MFHLRSETYQFGEKQWVKNRGFSHFIHKYIYIIWRRLKMIELLQSALKDFSSCLRRIKKTKATRTRLTGGESEEIVGAERVASTQGKRESGR